MDDPDAPSGTFTQWLLHDISAAASDLAEGQRPGQVGTTLKNDFGRPGYGGPCPPRGHGRHRYVFTLYALDVALGDRGALTKRDLEAGMHGHVLAQAGLVGTYEPEKSR